MRELVVAASASAAATDVTHETAATQVILKTKPQATERARVPSRASASG